MTCKIVFEMIDNKYQFYRLKKNSILRKWGQCDVRLIVCHNISRRSKIKLIFIVCYQTNYRKY